MDEDAKLIADATTLTEIFTYIRPNDGNAPSIDATLDIEPKTPAGHVARNRLIDVLDDIFRDALELLPV